MSRTRGPEYGGARDEVQDESVKYFQSSVAPWVRTQGLHVRSNSTQSAANAARRLPPVNLTAEGCDRLEIDRLSALQLLDKSLGRKGRQTLYRL